MADAKNIIVNATTGTKIGTATTQKIGFFNATPVVQEAGTNDVLASLVTLGLRAASSNPPLNIGTGALTCGNIACNQITIGDGQNIVLNTTTGTKIGTATTQKLSFFNATPVVQISAYTVTNPVTNRSIDVSTATAAQMRQIVGTIIQDIQSLGLFG